MGPDRGDELVIESWTLTPTEVKYQKMEETPSNYTLLGEKWISMGASTELSLVSTAGLQDGETLSALRSTNPIISLSR